MQFHTLGMPRLVIGVLLVTFATVQSAFAQQIPAAQYDPSGQYRSYRTQKPLPQPMHPQYNLPHQMPTQYAPPRPVQPQSVHQPAYPSRPLQQYSTLPTGSMQGSAVTHAGPAIQSTDSGSNRTPATLTGALQPFLDGPQPSGAGPRQHVYSGNSMAAAGLNQSPEWGPTQDPLPPSTYPPQPTYESQPTYQNENPDYYYLQEQGEKPQQTAPSMPDPGSLFRERKATLTWIPGSGDDLGITDYNLRFTLLAPPVPGLTVTPGYQKHFLDGPTRTDLPPRLENLRVEFSWMKQLNPRFGYQIAITPGYYSDFERSNSDAVRIVGRALGFYGHSKELQLVFGVVYLDRENISALPVAGLIYTPNPSRRLELVFPRPRYAMLVMEHPGQEYWGYIAGEFGGGSWAIERSSGAKDVLTYGDLRLLLGLEVKSKTGRSWLVEAGYVFGREVEYKSGTGDFDPDDAGLIRAGVTF